MDLQISVLIPTYNRADVLRKTLEAYSNQRGVDSILEILVVDDGSKDHTASVVKQIGRISAVPVRYFYQDNRGLAAARNCAIREASGSLLLFGDDDIIPSSDMVAAHLAWHRKYPEVNVGVLGHVAWAPEVHATPFMVWSGLYGPQFNFGYFKPEIPLDFRYAYFCNTSLKSSFLGQYDLFDETLRTYGYEDVELGYRLGQRGYRLLYNPDALGFHCKYETFEDTARRVEKLYNSWSGFAKTEAGAEFLRAWLNENRQPQKEISKSILKPLKVLAMRLLKPLCDTHIPLPGWLYNMIFYHYVKPFSRFVLARDQNPA